MGKRSLKRTIIESTSIHPYENMENLSNCGIKTMSKGEIEKMVRNFSLRLLSDVNEENPCLYENYIVSTTKTAEKILEEQGYALVGETYIKKDQLNIFDKFYYKIEPKLL